MGHSVTCNYQVNINFSNGSKLSGLQTCYGAMNFKQVKGIMLAEQNYRKEKGDNMKVVSAEIWPQTQRGRNSMQKDFAIMDVNGKIEHYLVEDEILTYTSNGKPMFEIVE